MSRKCPIYVQSLSRICLTFVLVQSLTNLCPGFVQNMSSYLKNVQILSSKKSSICPILVLPFHLDQQDKFWTKSGTYIFCQTPGNPATRQKLDKLWILNGNSCEGTMRTKSGQSLDQDRLWTNTGLIDDKIWTRQTVDKLRTKCGQDSIYVDKYWT